MLNIDGSYGEGGGQVLRTSLSLAATLGRNLHLFNIRASRSKPGLAAQHLTCVKAAAEVCGAQVEGAEIGSTELTFRPGAVAGDNGQRSRARKPDLRGRCVRGGRYAWKIGTAGSTSLVLQTVLPPLLFAREPSSVQVHGGTNVPWSPAYDYLERVFLPALRQTGANARLARLRLGFYPKGGGCVQADISPLAEPLCALDLTERGELQSLSALSLIEARLPDHILERQVQGAREALGRAAASLSAEILKLDAHSPGTMLMVAAQFERGFGGFTALGKRGRPAEKVGADAGKQAASFLNSGATVDMHLADQLVLYAALAEGITRYVTESISQHLTTNLWVVRQFLDLDCNLDEDTGLVEITGVGQEHRFCEADGAGV